MELPFDLAACVGAPPDHEGTCIGYVDERTLRGASGGHLGTVLEELGRRSALAQGLRRPVTFGTPSGLGDQRVYLLADGKQALGFLKVGTKRLFIAAAEGAFADVKGAFREIEPLCVLDFYIHERCQRAGHGRRLFDAMLSREQTSAERLGFDRPSSKLLAFMARHFGLSKFRPQSNNFVVFDAYFDPSAAEGGGGGGRRGGGGGDGPGRGGSSHPDRDGAGNGRLGGASSANTENRVADHGRHGMRPSSRGQDFERDGEHFLAAAAAAAAAHRAGGVGDRGDGHHRRSNRERGGAGGAAGVPYRQTAAAHF